MPTANLPAVEFGARPITLEQVVRLSAGRARAVIANDAASRNRVAASVEQLTRKVSAGEPIYGVTTGFGESCVNSIADEGIDELPTNLVRFHGCGTGRRLGEVETAAVIVARLASLARGYSAVRPELLQALASLLNRGVLPCIPEEGSVGASGDLTPLSYVASTLIGEREATFRGREMPSRAALLEAGLEALTLAPKEGLALMNGTSMMTGLACLAFAHAAKLARLAASLTAMTSDVLKGNRGHFHQRIFELKPHPGQLLVAQWIRDDVEYDGAEERHDGRLQDRYSLRCAPHVIGVLADALLSFRSTLQIELNSVNDNPLLVPDEDLILHSGNFYGGHVCFAMDALKTAIASVADLMDRQMLLLCSPFTNNHLPADLVGATGPTRYRHHGFKAMQITASALTAEALKLTLPAGSFSRSTESHNQDKVSMGTIAARDCLRVLELSEQVGAILLLATCQAVDLRSREGCHRRAMELHAAVREQVPFNQSDRRQDVDIAILLERYREDALPIGDYRGLFGQEDP